MGLIGNMIYYEKFSGCSLMLKSDLTGSLDAIVSEETSHNDVVKLFCTPQLSNFSQFGHLGFILIWAHKV